MLPHFGRLLLVRVVREEQYTDDDCAVDHDLYSFVPRLREQTGMVCRSVFEGRYGYDDRDPGIREHGIRGIKNRGSNRPLHPPYTRIYLSA